jgi:hypothetical protein
MAKKKIWKTQDSFVASVKDIKLNPNNPRTIRDSKFKKLVKSIQDFPAMLEIRPIVVDESMIILGGNMRFKALCTAGLTNVSVIQLKGLTEEQKKEFVIKDNASYGEWDWDMLANKFDSPTLASFGLDVWQPDLTYAPAELEDETDCDELELPPVASGSAPLVVKKVIQIEFMLGDYNEAFGLVTLLRSKQINIGDLLISSMQKQLANEN